MSRDRPVTLTTSTPERTVYVVHVHGPLDHAGAARAARLAEVRTRLRLRNRCATDLVVVDLAAVTSVDLGALPVLLGAHAACRVHGMAFTLAGLAVEVPERGRVVLDRIPQSPSVAAAYGDDPLVPAPREPTP